MLLYLLIFFGVVALFMFVHKVIWRSAMEKKLGRKVQDRELTSLTAWMEEPKQGQTPNSPPPSD